MLQGNQEVHGGMIGRLFTFTVCIVIQFSF